MTNSSTPVHLDPRWEAFLDATAKLTGPGTIWLQSLPFSRLASRIFAAAPQRGGSREEGSVLGGFAGGGLLGGILGGDDE